MSAAKTVLVVDDAVTVRQLLATVLEGNGFRVIQAVDGEDGLAKAKATSADLVISDVNMPKMNGLQMVGALRKLPAYSKVPIFMLTTDAGARVAEGKAAGATAWIVKPFRSETLLAGVRRVLAM
jgi:two-component system chemotaxis response regulator CheY